MSKRTYIIDPGHGGINPATGQYVTAGKRSQKWSDGSVYYEGVGNREIAKLVGEQLKLKGIKFKYSVDPSNHLDISLTARASVANSTPGNVVFISIHSNGVANPQANGYEVFTSPGQTKSDELATIWYQEMGKEFPDLKGRPDTTDGDPDKEAEFTVLTKTKCPAFLIETMFHTNEKECKILMSAEGKKRIANVIVRTIERIEKL